MKNNITLEAELTNDPRNSKTKNGSNRSMFQVKNKAKVFGTNYLFVQAFDKPAKYCRKLSKGDRVTVQGGMCRNSVRDLSKQWHDYYFIRAMKIHLDKHASKVSNARANKIAKEMLAEETGKKKKPQNHKPNISTKQLNQIKKILSK